MIGPQASVSVAELAARFGVSEATIRRDLNALSRLGGLQRTYGGALRPSLADTEAPFSRRQVSNAEEKARIGAAAAALVQSGETVFLDGGTTIEAMIPHLVEKAGLTVVTFGLNILTRLAGHQNITVIGIGGTLHHPSLTFTGVLATEATQAYRLRFDKAFIAARGVSATGGATNVDLEQIPIKVAALDASRQAFLLADSSKIGVTALAMIAPVARFHRLITGSGASAEEVDALRRMGLTVDLV